MTESAKHLSLDLDAPAVRRRRKIRSIKDKVASAGITFGGISIIGAVLLIFAYLLYEVYPLFVPASIETNTQYEMVAEGRADFLTLEEQAEVGFALDIANNSANFFSVNDGQLILQENLPVPSTATITSVAEGNTSSHLFAVGLSDGSAVLAKHVYKSTYDQSGKRSINPILEYPYGKEPIVVSQDGARLVQLAIRDGEDSLSIAAKTQTGALIYTRLAKEEDFLTEELTLEASYHTIAANSYATKDIIIDTDQRWLFSIEGEKTIKVYDVKRPSEATLVSEVKASEYEVTEVELLLGGISLLVGDSQGNIAQWFMVRDDQNQWTFEKVRSFDALGNSAITLIETEHRRKGFVVANKNGEVGFYHSTAGRQLMVEKVPTDNISQIAIAPRGHDLLVLDDKGKLYTYSVDNEHPEVSFQSLWQQVWYENYQEKDFIWQSSAANNDFEPKYSVMPLAFGTLKAAFYAMLFAAPLAIAGAVYTAYFMAPSLRRKIKPVIELMEALPTVILGFLAGLALAPFLEENLSGVMLLLILLPIAIIGFGFTWARLPKSITTSVPTGWDAALLIPVVILIFFFSMSMGPFIDALFFDGSLSTFLQKPESEGGWEIDYSQRNAMVVGFAMGFAVIPTIFSIAEDAVFSVPKHLTFGSLALGATPWQTLTRIVIPTASPGIFSALMIGMGRAVGETMIVLMATGNTPIMDINIFEGMRTLAANIAVEMPESEVGSSHYRILFLTGFVLFLFTFIVNTIAEVVRQRLRKQYGNL